MATFDLIEKVRVAESALADYVGAYKPLHREVRRLQAQAHRLEDDLEQLSRDLRRLSGSDAAAVSERQRLEREIDTRQRKKEELERGLPEIWEDARAGYVALETTERKARMTYRRNVDDAYAPIVTLRSIIAQSDALAALEPQLRGLEEAIAAQSPQEAMETLKAAESAVRAIEGTNDVGSLLAKTRRALKGDAPNKQEADAKLAEALDLYGEEVVWRRRAASDLSGGLEAYDDAVKDTIGLRLQQRLPIDIAKQVAACRSVHRDISLSF